MFRIFELQSHRIAASRIGCIASSTDEPWGMYVWSREGLAYIYPGYEVLMRRYRPSSIGYSLAVWRRSCNDKCMQYAKWSWRHIDCHGLIPCIQYESGAAWVGGMNRRMRQANKRKKQGSMAFYAPIRYYYEVLIVTLVECASQLSPAISLRRNMYIIRLWIISALLLLTCFTDIPHKWLWRNLIEPTFRYSETNFLSYVGIKFHRCAKHGDILHVNGSACLKRMHLG